MFIQAQDWASTQEERFKILDVLPGMEPPGMDLFSRERACQRFEARSLANQGGEPHGKRVQPDSNGSGESHESVAGYTPMLSPVLVPLGKTDVAHLIGEHH